MGTLFIFIAAAFLFASSIFFFSWNKYLKNKKKLKNQKENSEKEETVKTTKTLSQQASELTKNIEKLFDASVHYVNNSYSGKFRVYEALKNGEKVFFVDQLVDFIKEGSESDLFCLPEDLSLMKRGNAPLDDNDIIYLTEMIDIKYTLPLIKAERNISPKLSNLLKKHNHRISA